MKCALSHRGYLDSFRARMYFSLQEDAGTEAEQVAWELYPVQG